MPSSLSRVRPATLADARAIATIHVQTWLETYRGIIADEYLDTLSIEQREERWKVSLATNEAPVFVALDPACADPVGFITGGNIRDPFGDYDAELYAIYVLPAFHQRGHGQRLVRSLVDVLRAQGHSAMVVRVLTENPACRFYESIGGMRLGDEPHEVGGKEYRAAIYGWPSILQLAS